MGKLSWAMPATARNTTVSTTPPATFDKIMARAQPQRRNNAVQISDYGEDGAYIPNTEDSVYSSSHGHIAFIRIQGVARYVTIANVDATDKRRIGVGTQVDWQPLP